MQGIGMGLLMLFLITVITFLRKPLPSQEAFDAYMASQGFAAVEGMGMYSAAEKDGMVIEYKRAIDTNSAQHGAGLAIDNFKAEFLAVPTSTSETRSSMRVYLESSDRFFIVHQVENVMLYAQGSLSDAGQLKSLVSGIMPGNAVLGYMLVILGVGISGWRSDSCYRK